MDRFQTRLAAMMLHVTQRQQEEVQRDLVPLYLKLQLASKAGLWRSK